jgi:hypothetical protein
MPPASAAFAAALRQAVADVIGRRLSLDVAVARAVAQLGGDDEAPRERPAERRQRENADALTQMAELEQGGQRREAAMIVAKRMAIDRNDPAEVAILAQRLRRLRRRK